MGIMPIQRSRKGQKSISTKSEKNFYFLKETLKCFPGAKMPRTTFDWRSRTFLWAYFIFIILTILVAYTLQARIQDFITSSLRFDEVIYNIIFISLLLPHFLLPVASWRNGAEVAKFKNMWTNYQLEYYRVTGSPILFHRLTPLSWIGCVTSWMLSFILMISQYYFQPNFPVWHIFAYLHIIAMLNAFCCLWFLNCMAFGIVSQLLAKKLEETLLTQQPSKQLTKYRYLWNDLSELMKQLGRAYSNMYGIYCLMIFFTTIVSLYGVASEFLEHSFTYKELGLVIIVIYCSMLLFIICNMAHDATEKVC